MVFLDITPLDTQFLVRLLLSLLCGFLIGAERESRGKAAGISTHSFVVGGAMLFSLISTTVDPESTTRIAAQIVTGIGFLGAGIILVNKNGELKNVTTAASIWFAAAIGTALGFGWYVVALLATLYALIVPRIPRIKYKKR